MQPQGALIVAQEPDLRIVQASANAASFLGLDSSPQGRTLDQLPGDLADSIRPHLQEIANEIPGAFRCRVGSDLAEFDVVFHRPPRGGVVIELELAGPAVDLSKDVESALQAIRNAASLQELGDQTATLFKRIAGFDRAMVYRFDDQGHGEVFAERRNPDLESYLGQRYPASDIPQIARKLYERNRVRILTDVSDERIPLEPRLNPLTGEDLDMSLCFLRAMSPIHIEYLQNMGVRATLVASIIVGDKLWGLVACHNYSPRFAHYEVRAICELLAESVAMRVAALESFLHAQAELTVRRIEQRMLEEISRDGDWRSALFDGSPVILQPLNAVGSALLFEGQILTTGEVPGTQQLREIGAWLDAQQPPPVLATASLGRDEPAFESLAEVASGLVAARISSSPGEYLLWFRPARVRTITWGGNPFKPYLVGDDPMELSPRRSFEKWHQQVDGTSEPWSPADLTAAKVIGQAISDVVIQFRSVRVLVAQDQLSNVRRQVQSSDYPVIIADPDGQILVTNEAFEQLLQSSHPHLHRISDLPGFFEDPAELRSLFSTLLGRQRACRGEVQIRSRNAELQTLIIRGDPVLISPERLLGYVVTFIDQTERRVAEAARRRFQQELVAPHPHNTLDAEYEPTYQNLMASIVGNAQLTAMEITDGVDPSRMPRMLESARRSVTRAAELLEHLVSHASNTGRRGE